MPPEPTRFAILFNFRAACKGRQALRWQKDEIISLHETAISLALNVVREHFPADALTVPESGLA